MGTRRNFIKSTGAAGIGLAFWPDVLFGRTGNAGRLKVGLIGVGLRGTNHLENLLLRKDTLVTAICDLDPARIDLCLNLISKSAAEKPKVFGKNELDYKNLLDLKEVDAVIISTPWTWHAKMAKDAMLAGKYTGLEVSAASTLDECWDLVNTHEKTGTHLMILENVNYRRDIMAVLNMVRQDVFGELIHFRCGYQHDLRFVKFNDGKTAYGRGAEFGEKGISEAKWRTQHSIAQNADVYPTHGLGPVAVMNNINRGNRFLSLTSHATKSRGLHNYVVEVGGKDHPNTQVNFKLGDVITSTINTSKGETILITHDTNLPRPYSLGFRVQGTKGLWENDGDRIFVEGRSPGHDWEPDAEWLKKYDHPLWKKYGTFAEGSGHGGMDFFVLQAFVESAKEKMAPPMDVYDAAAWSAVTPLSEASIANNNAPQDFPDFTRGLWEKREVYNWMKDTF